MAEDHFEAVNDTHDHLAEGQALKAVAHLTVCFREYDVVGRFGGEEFALLLPQTKAIDAYRIVTEPVKAGVSIRVAALEWWDTRYGSPLTDLLAAADGGFRPASSVAVSLRRSSASCRIAAWRARAWSAT
jgi:GGDEF domain-containing protein